MRDYIVLNGDRIRELSSQSTGATVPREVEDAREEFRMMPGVTPISAESATESSTRELIVFPPLTDPVQAAVAVERRLQSTEGIPSVDLTTRSDNRPSSRTFSMSSCRTPDGSGSRYRTRCASTFDVPGMNTGSGSPTT